MNKRMRQLTALFSAITGKTLEESMEIILQTETGNAVNENNMAIMYEQQTENLYEIAEELKRQENYAEIAEMLSIENIVSAMKEFQDRKDAKKTDKIPYMQREPKLKSEYKNNLLSKRKRILQIKRQNQISEGRVKHAANIEG